MQRRRVFVVLFATILLDMVGIGMLIPIIPIIFTDPSSTSFMLDGFSKSAQYTMAGLLTALFGLMQFLASPLFGELSDIYGRKRLLTLGVGILALSQLLFGFGVETGSLIILFISRIIAGLAGGNISIVQASIADITPPNDRAKNFGLIGVAVGIGFIIGPVLGGFIATAVDNAAAPFWFASALGIINVLSISLFLPETHHNRKAEKNFHPWKGIHNIQAAWRDHDARPVYLANFFHFAGFNFFVSFIGILLVARYSLSESAIGTYFGAVGFWIILTQGFILRIISDRYHERQILRISIIIVALTILSYPFVPTLIWMYILVPFLAIPNGLTMANLTSLVSRSVSAHKQGAALGINSSLTALAQGVIPLLAGFGSGLFGVTTPFIAGSILCLTAWGILFFYRR